MIVLHATMERLVMITSLITRAIAHTGTLANIAKRSLTGKKTTLTLTKSLSCFASFAQM